MKKAFLFILLALLTTLQGHAVLKEKDLPQTLQILRTDVGNDTNQPTAERTGAQPADGHHEELEPELADALLSEAGLRVRPHLRLS